MDLTTDFPQNLTLFKWKDEKGDNQKPFWFQGTDNTSWHQFTLLSYKQTSYRSVTYMDVQVSNYSSTDYGTFLLDGIIFVLRVMRTFWKNNNRKLKSISLCWQHAVFQLENQLKFNGLKRCAKGNCLLTIVKNTTSV